MSDEIDTIVRSFRANVMSEIQSHRVINGAGTIAAFAVDVRRHKQRVLSKLEAMRPRLPGEALESAATAINDIADAVIARVESAGFVEFADGAI